MLCKKILLKYVFIALFSVCGFIKRSIRAKVFFFFFRSYIACVNGSNNG